MADNIRLVNVTPCLKCWGTGSCIVDILGQRIWRACDKCRGLGLDHHITVAPFGLTPMHKAMIKRLWHERGYTVADGPQRLWLGSPLSVDVEEWKKGLEMKDGKEIIRPVTMDEDSFIIATAMMRGIKLMTAK